MAQPGVPPSGWADPANPFDSRPHNPAWQYPGAGQPAPQPQPTPPPVQPLPPVVSQALPAPTGLRLRIFLPNLVVISWDRYLDVANVELHLLRTIVDNSGMLGRPGTFELIAMIPTNKTAWHSTNEPIGTPSDNGAIYTLAAVNLQTGASTEVEWPNKYVGTHLVDQVGV